MQNDNELLEAIRKQLRFIWISRTQLDPDEIVNEVYLRLANAGLIDKGKIPTDKEILSIVRQTVRSFRRAVKASRNIENVPESEHPFYEEEESIHAREFEETYLRFCDSLDEPQRTICLKFRTVGRHDLAMLANVSVKNVSKTLKKLPGMFERFLASSR